MGYEKHPVWSKRLLSWLLATALVALVAGWGLGYLRADLLLKRSDANCACKIAVFTNQQVLRAASDLAYLSSVIDPNGTGLIVDSRTNNAYRSFVDANKSNTWLGVENVAQREFVWFSGPKPNDLKLSGRLGSMRIGAVLLGRFERITVSSPLKGSGNPGYRIVLSRIVALPVEPPAGAVIGFKPVPGFDSLSRSMAPGGPVTWISWPPPAVVPTYGDYLVGYAVAFVAWGILNAAGVAALRRRRKKKQDQLAAAIDKEWIEIARSMANTPDTDDPEQYLAFVISRLSASRHVTRVHRSSEPKEYLQSVNLDEEDWLLFELDPECDVARFNDLIEPVVAQYRKLKALSWANSLVSTLGVMEDAVVVLEGCKVRYANPAFVKIFGKVKRMAEVLAVFEELTDPLGAALIDESSSAMEVLCRRPGGTLWMLVSISAKVSGKRSLIFKDVSSWHADRERLAYESTHDALTELANRRWLEVAFPTIVDGSSGVLLLLDLDRFKPLNDTFGHQAGDEALKVVAQRLSGTARTSDFLCRLGGDEFALLIPCEPNKRSSLLADLTSRIKSAISAPIAIGEGVTWSLDLSAGIACWPEDGQELNRLLRLADAGLYRAKAKQDNSWWAYLGSVTGIIGDLENYRANSMPTPVRHEPATERTVFGELLELAESKPLRISNLRRLAYLEGRRCWALGTEPDHLVKRDSSLRKVLMAASTETERTAAVFELFLGWRDLVMERFDAKFASIIKGRVTDISEILNRVGRLPGVVQVELLTLDDEVVNEEGAPGNHLQTMVRVPCRGSVFLRAQLMDRYVVNSRIWRTRLEDLAAKISSLIEARYTSAAQGSNGNDRLALEIPAPFNLEQVIYLAQPIVCLKTGNRQGVEVLARLLGLSGEIIAPQHFMGKMNNRELETLFWDAIEKSVATYSDLAQRISVNVAPSTISRSGFVKRLARTLEALGYSPDRLEIELTEGEEIDAIPVRELKELGVALALDDFGTGFANWAHVARGGFDTIKVDRSLLKVALDAPARGLAVLAGAVVSASSLGSRIVAEGIETRSLLEACIALGIESGQGYYIGYPMDAMALAEHEGPTISSEWITTALGAFAYHRRGFLFNMSEPETDYASCPVSGYVKSLGNFGEQLDQFHRKYHMTGKLSPKEQEMTVKLLTSLVAAETLGALGAIARH
jgi:diguanylate cyclase (GGDEF)-like protein